MTIKDILVYIKLAEDWHKDKGILAFAIVKFRISWKDKTRYLVNKGFTIRRSDKGIKDKFGHYTFVQVPAAPNRKFKKYTETIFFENEDFNKDEKWWGEVADKILEEYYKTISHL